jgi:hypothetical protein
MPSNATAAENFSCVCRHAPDGEHGNVILLPELPCRLDNQLCGLIADGLRPLKAIEFALRVGRFHHAIGDEREPVAGSDLIARLFVARLADHAERQALGDVDLVIEHVERVDYV